jgi:hypothetical protein
MLALRSSKTLPSLPRLRKIDIFDPDQIVHANVLTIFQDDEFFFIGHFGIQDTRVDLMNLIGFISVFNFDHFFAHGKDLDVVVDIAGDRSVICFHIWETTRGMKGLNRIEY